MSLYLTITLTLVGTDQGPYNIYYIDGSSTITPGPTNVGQSFLLAGYNAIIPDGTVTVRVQSVNSTCEPYYLDLNVPS